MIWLFIDSLFLSAKRKNPAGPESRLDDFLLKFIEQQTCKSQQLFRIFLSYYYTHETVDLVLSVESARGTRVHSVTV